MTIKEVKINFIADCALELFLQHGILNVSVTQIAKQAGVGEATIYRYFDTKQNLVLMAAARLSDRIFEKYCNYGQGKNGLEKLSEFYSTYLTIFTDSPQYFGFINQLDAFMIASLKTDDALYAQGLDNFKKVCDKAYNEGLQDKSVKKVPSWDLFYYATTHALMELCKKLSSADVVRQDKTALKTEEIKLITDLILSSLKA